FTGGDTGVAISKKAGMVPLQMELMFGVGAEPRVTKTTEAS
ncbi:hypothetical protein Tco_0330472, partial [Tanacetum coccineum]